MTRGPPPSRWTPEIVAELGRRRMAGETRISLATSYGVSQARIREVLAKDARRMFKALQAAGTVFPSGFDSRVVDARYKWLREHST